MQTYAPEYYQPAYPKPNRDQNVVRTHKVDSVIKESIVGEAEPILTTKPQGNYSLAEQAVILVVEDAAPSNKSSMATLLSQSGYQILAADGSQQALKRLQDGALQQVQPEIILLDISVPSLNGFEICRQIKAEPEVAHIPILFLSDHNEPESKVQGFNAGGVDYIIKPFEQEELLARVNLHLSIFRQHRKLQAEKQALTDKIQAQSQLLAVATEMHELATKKVASLRQERINLLNLACKRKSQRPTPQRGAMLGLLTDREKEILKLIAQSCDNKEIADALVITESTVRSYRSRISNKLSIQNEYDLMRVALENFSYSR